MHRSRLTAYFRMIFIPPGCSGRNSVTSYALPCTTTQQSSWVLCLATSCPVRGMLRTIQSLLMLQARKNSRREIASAVF